jgi:hypothetical protein
VSDESVLAPQTDVEEIRVLTVILNNLRQVSPEARERILQTAATYFGLNLRASSAPLSAARTLSGPGTSFSEDRAISPKEFILQKQPRSDVDKVACLAFYLTHYRDTPHFKTLEISKLNTEAAQVKFSNTAVAVDNAAKKGLLVSAEKGQKQLSAIGEQYVLALPDQEAAQTVLSNMRRRRKTRKMTPAQSPPSEESVNESDGQ